MPARSSNLDRKVRCPRFDGGHGRANHCRRILVGVATTVYLSLVGTADGVAGDGLGRAPEVHQADQFVQTSDHSGVRLEFSLKALDPASAMDGVQAGQTWVAQVTLRDADTQAPLLGVRPRAWLTARLSETLSDETSCKSKVKTLVAGQLTARADIDLNGYAVVTLNHDKTVSFINPQVVLGGTQLENMIQLPGVGMDWVLGRDGTRLYVTMPDESSMAIIDTTTRKLLHVLSTGPDSRPGRILLQPDGRALWVGLDGTGQVAVIDARAQRVMTILSVGQGMHALSMTGDGRFVYVTNSRSNTVSVINAETRTVSATVPVDETPVAVTYSAAAQRIYVGALNGTTLSVIDPTVHRVVGRIPTRQGTVAVGAEPQGRFLVAVNQLDSRVSVVDTASNRVIAASPVVREPDQVVFTDRYAYVRGIESEKVTLLDLRDLRRGTLSPLDVQIGRQAPSADPQELGPASMIVPTPEGNAVLVANAPDATLYFYQEGMMAPMGTFSTYRRKPRGVLVLDRSLKEVEPGMYRAPITPAKAGRFDVPVLIDQPRVVHCFQMTVQPSPIRSEAGGLDRPPTVQFLPPKVPTSAKVPTELEFSLSDPETHHPIIGLTDVRVLMVETPGGRQQRQWAKEIAPGRYRVTHTFPRPGDYRVLIQASSRRLRYVDTAGETVTVVSTSKPATQPREASSPR